MNKSWAYSILVSLIEDSPTASQLREKGNFHTFCFARHVGDQSFPISLKIKEEFDLIN